MGPTTIDVLMWCFQQNYYLDKSNAAVHCAPVKFSPITFRIAMVLFELWDPHEEWTGGMHEVKGHMGQYDWDYGR